MINLPDEIIRLLQKDSTKKNIRIHFPNGERDDITNDNIVSESLTLNESLCSQNELKFGLCETSYIEFETFGVGKIKGATIECSIEVPYATQSETATLSSGSYLDAPKCIPKTQFTYVHSNAFLQRAYVVTPDNVQHKLTKSSDSESASIIWEEAYNAEGTKILVFFSIVPSNYHFEYSEWYPISLGTFVVDSCKKQADMSHRKIIAYAKENWKLEQIYKDVLSNIYWHNSSIGISPDAIIKMLFPNYKVNMQTVTSYTSMIASEYTETVESHQIKMTVKYKYFDLKRDTISTVIEHYSSQFANDVNAIVNKIKEYGGSSLLKTSSNDVFSGYTKIRHGTASGSSYIWDYDYVSSDDVIKTTSISKVLDATDGKKVVFPYLYKNDQIYLTRASEGWTATSIPEGKYKIPKEIHLFYDGTEVKSAIDDSNYAELDIDESVNITAETYGVYFNPIVYKKSLPMIKSTDSSEITKQLYTLSSTVILNKDFRDSVEAYCELYGKFGRIKRDGTFEMISLNDKIQALYPSETLYPSDDLYPSENIGDEINTSEYQSLWYDDDNTLPYGKVVCEFLVNEGESEDLEWWCGVTVPQTNPPLYDYTDSSTYKTYDISNNELIRDKIFLKATIQLMLQNISSEIDKIAYMPSTFVMRARPDLETGDMVTIKTDEGWISTFILKRTMNGIQNIIDEITSE